MRDDADFVFIAIVSFFVAILLFAVFAMFQSAKLTREFREQCIAAGGVPFMPRREWVCLKADQIQPMKEAK